MARQSFFFCRFFEHNEYIWQPVGRSTYECVGHESVKTEGYAQELAIEPFVCNPCLGYEDNFAAYSEDGSSYDHPEEVGGSDGIIIAEDSEQDENLEDDVSKS